MRRLPLAAASFALLLASCANPGEVITDQIAKAAGKVEDLITGGKTPGEYLQQIRVVHEPNGLVFKADAEDAFEVTRVSIRGLAESDYGTWSELAYAAQIVSTMSDQHSVALVRAEALDTLAVMAGWALPADTETGDWSTETELIAALQVLKEAAGKDISDPQTSFEVGDAIRTAAAFDFEGGWQAPEGASDRVVSGIYAARLRSARAVLFPLTTDALKAFRSDPEVRDALDRSAVALSAAVIRLTLVTVALRDPAPTTRSTAVRHLGNVRWSGAATVLRRVVRNDREAGVRREAAHALGFYRPDDSVPALIEALSDEVADVRGAAARSLATSTGQSFGNDRRAWARWWGSRPKTDPDAEPAEPPAQNR